MGLSTFLRQGMDLDRWIELAQALHLGAVEFRADPGAAYAPDLNPSDRRRLRARLAEANLGCTVHVPIYGVNLSSPIPSLAAASLGEVVRAVDLARDLGAYLVVLHPGHVDSDYLPLDGERDLALRRFTWALGVVLARAGDLPVALENKQRSRGWDMVHTPQEHRRFLDEFPTLRACLDVGHLHTVGGDVQAYVETLGARLAHVHLHDNGGERDDHLPLGQGGVNWRRAVTALDAAGYPGLVVLELPDPAGVRDSVALLEGA